jgi:hypothetical protein
LLGVTASLVAIHLTLTLKAGEVDHLGMSVIFWLAAAYLLYEKRHDVKLENSALSSAGYVARSVLSGSRNITMIYLRQIVIFNVPRCFAVNRSALKNVAT